MKIELTSGIIVNIKSWCKDFEKSTPPNLMVYDSGSTFEADAYQYFQEILAAVEESK